MTDDQLREMLGKIASVTHPYGILYESVLEFGRQVRDQVTAEKDQELFAALRNSSESWERVVKQTESRVLAQERQRAVEICDLQLDRMIDREKCARAIRDPETKHPTWAPQETKAETESRVRREIADQLSIPNMSPGPWWWDTYNTVFQGKGESAQKICSIPDHPQEDTYTPEQITERSTWYKESAANAAFIEKARNWVVEELRRAAEEKA